MGGREKRNPEGGAGSAGTQLLYFEGIATFADIYVGGAKIGEADYVHHEGTLLVALPRVLRKDEKITFEVRAEGDILDRPDGNSYWILRTESWYPKPLALYQVRSGFSAVSTFGASLSLSAPFDIVMTIGWAALIMWLIKVKANEALRARLAATGRMAFTNYLVTSIIMTTIFYGYGLGLFGSVGRAALYLFCFGMWAAMLLWSKPWLERFQYGPLEWLWRSLSRWQVQPMRKIPVA